MLPAGTRRAGPLVGFNPTLDIKMAEGAEMSSRADLFTASCHPPEY